MEKLNTIKMVRKLQAVSLIFLFTVSIYCFVIIMKCANLSKVGEGFRSMEEIFIVVVNVVAIGLLFVSYKFKNLFFKIIFFTTVLYALFRIIKFISGSIC